MTALELVDFIFSRLDKTIQDNLYFQELKKIVYSNIQDDFLSIKVDETLYNQLPLNDFLVEVGSSIFEFRSGPLYLNIVFGGDLYIIELELKKEDNIISTVATTGDFSRIETSSILLQDGKYIDYDANVYYYKNNKMLPMVISGEKDYVFSTNFHIPLRLARFFRLNFKKFGTYFDKYKETEEFSEIESYLDEKDYYAFIGSFKIRDFIGFIKGYVFTNMNSSLLKVLAKNGKFNDLMVEREFILEVLSSFIRSDGEGVITYCLYQEILLYLTGCVPSLNAKGFIIQKFDDFYMLYFITFYNNELHIESRCVTHEEVLSMYEQNEFNKENNSLASFFGTGLAR